MLLYMETIHFIKINNTADEFSAYIIVDDSFWLINRGHTIDILLGIGNRVTVA